MADKISAEEALEALLYMAAMTGVINDDTAPEVHRKYKVARTYLKQQVQAAGEADSTGKEPPMADKIWARDRTFVISHQHQAIMAQNYIDASLSASEILQGVRVPHEDYVHLVKLATLAVEQQAKAEADNEG